MWLTLPKASTTFLGRDQNDNNSGVISLSRAVTDSYENENLLGVLSIEIDTRYFFKNLILQRYRDGDILAICLRTGMILFHPDFSVALTTGVHFSEVETSTELNDIFNGFSPTTLERQFYCSEASSLVLVCIKLTDAKSAADFKLAVPVLKNQNAVIEQIRLENNL